MENREKVPARYRKNAQTATLLDTLGLSAQEMAELVEDVKKQFFIATATWSLPLWERQGGRHRSDSKRHRAGSPQCHPSTAACRRHHQCRDDLPHGDGHDRL